MGERGPIGKGDGGKLDFEKGKPRQPRGLNSRESLIYKATCEHLNKADALQLVDGGVVFRYARWMALWEKESKTLVVEGGVTVPVIEGLEAKVNPRLTAVHKIDTMLAAAEKKLGFSPEDRMRIKGSVDKKQSRLGGLKDRLAKKTAKKSVKKTTANGK